MAKKAATKRPASKKNGGGKQARSASSERAPSSRAGDEQHLPRRRWVSALRFFTIALIWGSLALGAVVAWYAWDLPDPPNPVTVDVARYEILLLRAAATIFKPLGVEEDTLRDWLFSNAGYLAPPGKLPSPPTKNPPLWGHQPTMRVYGVHL